MNRYRSYGDRDDQPEVVGDGAFKGVDEYNAIENIAEGEVQQAVNMDFTSQDAVTRGGFVCLPELSTVPFGQTWNQTTLSGYYFNQFNNVAYGQGLFVTLMRSSTSTNNLLTSPDGIVWTLRSLPATSVTFGQLAFANGRFILTGSTAILYSDDGINWFFANTPPTFNVSPSTGTFFGSGKWVIVSASNGGSVAISTDNGVNWTSYTGISQLTAFVRAGIFANGLFIVPYGNGIIKSVDGIVWEQVDFYTLNPPVPIYSTPTDLTWDGKYLYLIGLGGDIYRSTDTITWEIVRDYVVGNASLSIASIRGFSITGTESGIAYSINGKKWVNVPAFTPIPTYICRSVVDSGTRTLLTFSPAATGSTIVLYSDNVVPSIFCSGVYSDPYQSNSIWIMLVGGSSVGFFSSGKSRRVISLGGNSVTSQSTIVQCNNLVYIFRGPNATPLYWNGDWSSTFQLAPTPTPPSGFQIIPNSNQATYYQNRLWVKKGKDEILASDILDFNTYETITNSFNLNTGSSDYIVATFPFGEKTLLVFKNKSILALNNVDGSLADVTATEVTRQVGLVGIRAITSVGPDLAYVSYRNVNLITLTSTNNSVQHKTLPLSFKIKKIMDRVNWEYSWKISLGYADNKLYVALPLDNSIFCNAVAVYNFVTGQWYGEWNFDESLNMCIQDWVAVDYLGLQQMHAVTEDGRIFVTGQGNDDIYYSTFDIATTLVTRAYDTTGLNHYQRRMFMDLATLRPSFSVVAYTEGASESSTLITNQTYSRSESWKFNDTTYDLTNANDDYNRAYRKDYSSGANNIQPKSGFQPEMLQEFRLPLITTRQGRLSWLEITNTQGTINIMSAGFETRPGQRSNLVQV
jgi:hypothetical protein